MNSGRELDILVAEKVMGWTEVQSKPQVNQFDMSIQGVRPGEIPSTHTGYLPRHVVPNYSTDIKAAWEVVDRVKDMQFPVDLYGDLMDLFQITYRAGTWLVGWIYQGTEGTENIRHFQLSAEEETVAHAICLAALKAVNAL